MTRKITKSGSMTRRRLLTTVSAGAALAASPFRINLLQAQEANIKIGFPVPLTGPYGTEAQDQVRAGQLAVAQFNDAGGLNGRKAELVVRDDKLNPGEAATRTLELVEKEKVNFVVGSLSAAVQLAINNVTKERGIIFNSISQSDAINEAADFSRFTEQNVELALDIADRAYVLDQGAVVYHAAASDLLADNEIKERYCSV